MIYINKKINQDFGNQNVSLMLDDETKLKYYPHLDFESNQKLFYIEKRGVDYFVETVLSPEELQNAIDDAIKNRNYVVVNENTSENMAVEQTAMDFMAETQVQDFKEQWIEKILKTGSVFSKGKVRITNAYLNGKKKAFSSFLKDEYGCGGSSNNGVFFESSPKGIKIEIRGQENPEENFKTSLSWDNVAKRIGKLIDEDNYLTDNEKIEYNEYFYKLSAEEYNRAIEENPKDFETPFTETLLDDLEKGAENENIDKSVITLKGVVGWAHQGDGLEFKSLVGFTLFENEKTNEWLILKDGTPKVGDKELKIGDSAVKEDILIKYKGNINGGIDMFISFENKQSALEYFKKKHKEFEEIRQANIEKNEDTIARQKELDELAVPFIGYVNEQDFSTKTVQGWSVESIIDRPDGFKDAIVHRKTETLDDYLIARVYDEKTGTWGQGVYDFVSYTVANEVYTKTYLETAKSNTPAKKYYDWSNADKLGQKYHELEFDYPGAIVVYRLGDFYEIFGNSAEISANILDLTLTKRDFGMEERLPMVGFPYHIKDKYIDILNENNDIVVFESDNEQPKFLKSKLRIAEELELEEMIESKSDIFDNTLYGVVYNYKGLLEENYVYTETQLKELDESFIPDVDEYEGAFVANKTYTVYKLSRNTKEETIKNVREFMTGVYNNEYEPTVNDEWYWETRTSELFSGSNNNPTTIEWIARLGVTEKELYFNEEDRLPDDYPYGLEKGYKKVGSKTVYDAKGFTSDYTWWKNDETGHSVFFFDDTEDWEEDNDVVAQEHFDNYKGFEEVDVSELETPKNTSEDVAEDLSVEEFVAEKVKEIKWLNGRTGDLTEDEIQDIVNDLKADFEISPFNTEKEFFDDWYDSFAEETLESVLSNMKNIQKPKMTEDEIIMQSRITADYLVKTTGQPHIVFNWSEHKNYSTGEVMTFEDANNLLDADNRQTASELGYYKTKLDIYYRDKHGEVSSYMACRYDIGSEQGDLIEHIQEVVDYQGFGKITDETVRQEIIDMLDVLRVSVGQVAEPITAHGKLVESIEKEYELYRAEIENLPARDVFEMSQEIHIYTELYETLKFANTLDDSGLSS